MVNSSVLLQHRVLRETRREVKKQTGTRKKGFGHLPEGLDLLLLATHPQKAIEPLFSCSAKWVLFLGPLSLELSHCSSIGSTVSSGSPDLSST